MSRVAVFGTGSWGTAFALVLADAGNSVTLCGRRSGLCDLIDREHRNPDHLPGVVLPAAVRATTDPARAAEGADVVVVAVPTRFLRANLAVWSGSFGPAAVLVSLMKGLEPGTGRRMSEVVAEVTGAGPERVAVLSGPNLAPEIAARQPAASVVACADEAVAQRLQLAFRSPYFRPYTNTDVVGVELCGAVKNVIALACGMAQGMGLGDNTKASVLTRGLAEMTRLGLAMGADAQTFAGLAGLGDLVATCTSSLSRNRTVGVNLGLGMGIDRASAAQTAEGVRSCASILALARAHGVDMPITEGVVAVVHGGLAPGEMMARMMLRVTRPEGG